MRLGRVRGELRDAEAVAQDDGDGAVAEDAQEGRQHALDDDVGARRLDVEAVEQRQHRVNEQVQRERAPQCPLVRHAELESFPEHGRRLHPSAWVLVRFKPWPPSSDE